jgi:hypothetical protein
MTGKWPLRASFAKQKTRNVQHEAHAQVTKGHKAAKYGIPDSSCRRSSDGALRADHRRLPETARMVTVNLYMTDESAH